MMQPDLRKQADDAARGAAAVERVKTALFGPIPDPDPLWTVALRWAVVPAVALAGAVAGLAAGSLIAAFPPFGCFHGLAAAASMSVGGFAGGLFGPAWAGMIAPSRKLPVAWVSAMGSLALILAGILCGRIAAAWPSYCWAGGYLFGVIVLLTSFRSAADLDGPFDR